MLGSWWMIQMIQHDTALSISISTSDSPTKMDLEAVTICVDLRRAVHLRSRFKGRSNYLFVGGGVP